MKEYRIDCSKFCGYVSVDDNNIILKTMDVFRKFKGQPLSNLTGWVKKKFDYCTLEELK
jgi:hypothetical protein